MKVCVSMLAWLDNRLPNQPAKALSGQDMRALEAFCHLLALWAAADDDAKGAVEEALGATVRVMQVKSRRYARAVIPHVLDWGHETKLWARISKRALRVL